MFGRSIKRERKKEKKKEITRRESGGCSYTLTVFVRNRNLPIKAQQWIYTFINFRLHCKETACFFNFCVQVLKLGVKLANIGRSAVDKSANT